MTRQQVYTGIEVLRNNEFAALRGKRVGLLTNPSAVDRNLVSTYDILRFSPQVELTTLFSPEHGFTAAAVDGEIVNSAIDTRTGLPVYSLYGTTQRPTQDMLTDVDVIVCDIQDIGVRYYTFAWTISHILEAAGEYNREVVILDRPNPLSDTIAGAPLDMHFASLVGRYPVPTQHGMSLGEIMGLCNSLRNPTPARLTVIPCLGYQRKMQWEDTGLPFVPPSPNMPHLITVQHYPGACLIEGTALSEGRGTALPFEIVGAPEIDAPALADALNAQNWASVRFRPQVFKPTTSKYAGEVCSGVQVHITDKTLYHPLEVWVNVLSILYKQYSFTWNNNHFDRLIGTNIVREKIEAGEHLDDLFEAWHIFCAEFSELRRPFLIYN